MPSAREIVEVTVTNTNAVDVAWTRQTISIRMPLDFKKAKVQVIVIIVMMNIFYSRPLRCKFIALTPSHFIAIPCQPSRSYLIWVFRGSRTFAHRRTSQFPSVYPFGWQSILLWSFSGSPDCPGHDDFSAGLGREPSGATSRDGGSVVLGAVMSSERCRRSTQWES
jgi:hypothetical protein